MIQTAKSPALRSTNPEGIQPLPDTTPFPSSPILPGSVASADHGNPTTHKEFVEGELVRLTNKGIIEEVERCDGQVVSNIFLRPKKDGTYVTRFGIMSRKSPKVELRYGPRKSE